MQDALPGLGGPDPAGPPAGRITGPDESGGSDETGRLIVVPHGPPARDELVALVARLHAADPLAPVTVAVPSSLAGLALRRAIGARGGLVNVRCTALARIAELLGAPALAAEGRRPLTSALRLEAIHTALRSDAGPLASVREHPATAAALAATFAELDELSDAEREVIAARSERAGSVVRLHDAFRALTADCYDVDDVVRAAARAVDDAAPSATEVGHVVVHLPTSLTHAEAALLAALARRDRLTVVLGASGDGAVEAGLTDVLADRLRPILGAPARRQQRSSAPLAQRLISAPDPDDEVRAVARELDARARRGQTLGRVAVLWRVGEPYERLVPEVLDAASIPWTGASAGRVADAAAGRILLGLLALADTDLARDDVAAWLAAGPVIDPADGRRVNATRWDVVSREAGVVAGAEQWAARLRVHREAIDADLADVEATAEATEWQVERLRRAGADADALAAFVADVAAALVPPEPATWASFAQWAAGLLTRYGGAEHQRHDWPERELDAARAVSATLDELAGLDAVGDGAGPLDLARFRRTLVAELDTRLERVGRFGTGVLVGALGQAYAGDLDAVYVLGAVEGSLPPRGREDPLLPDRERRGVAALAQHSTRRLEERRDYLAALAAAPERVLTFPRADPRAQRKRLPARWVLESAKILAGRDLTAEELRDEAPASEWLDVVQSFEGLVRRGDPASEAEYALRSLRAWHDAGRDLAEHPLAEGALARGYVAAAQRGAWHATRYDGFLGDSPELAPGRDRATSPTALQGWAECPFRYYLGRVLRLHDIPRPEATEVISALDEGSLVHAVLEEFVRDTPTPSAPEAPWTDADATRMAEIVDRHCAEAERRGITGREVLWELARRRIVATAARFLQTDELVRASLGVVPAPDGLERGFGTDDRPPVEVDVGRDHPVRFRGRIDRVDRSPDGSRTVVYDYKTGKRRRYETLVDDPVHGGRLLQLPVYALAARQQEGTDDAVAAYWFTADPPDRALLPVRLDEETEERFVDVVSTIVDGIAQGCFPAYPGDRAWDPSAQRETWASCRWCEFDRLCPVDRGAAWERIADDPAAAPFVALDDIDDEVDEIEEGSG